MENRKIFLIGIFALIIGLSVLSQINYQIKENKVEDINCETISPIFFKPSEGELAGKAANKYNIISVVPEENYLIARTEVLDCPNFDYRDYINLDGWTN